MLRKLTALAIGWMVIGSGLAADRPSQKLTFFFTGLVQGNYEPCG
ncbi:MAG: hypothetical protein ACRD1R_09225 [Acidobacteriota bacterium]